MVILLLFVTQIIYRYTVSVAGTTITGLDDLGKALTYTPGYVAVYVNGFKLIETLDYTASSGSSVVFISAVQIGDVVEIIAYGTYSLGPYALATQAEAIAGTSNSVLMTPLRVSQYTPQKIAFSAYTVTNQTGFPTELWSKVSMASTFFNDLLLYNTSLS